MKKEPISFRASAGTRERLAAAAQAADERPYTLAGELLALALSIAEAQGLRRLRALAGALGSSGGNEEQAA